MSNLTKTQSNKDSARYWERTHTLQKQYKQHIHTLHTCSVREDRGGRKEEHTSPAQWVRARGEAQRKIAAWTQRKGEGDRPRADKKTQRESQGHKKNRPRDRRYSVLKSLISGHSWDPMYFLPTASKTYIPESLWWISYLKAILSGLVCVHFNQKYLKDRYAPKKL